LGKKASNSVQGAVIRWPIVPRSAWPIVPHVANLKINVPQGKFILEFAVILVSIVETSNGNNIYSHLSKRAYRSLLKQIRKW